VIFFSIFFKLRCLIPIPAVIPLGQDSNKFREMLKGLKERHTRHYLVWNFTDPDKRKFETKEFDDQVSVPWSIVFKPVQN
jgi:hypothetical protein